jgi:hypothetical protein
MNICKACRENPSGEQEFCSTECWEVWYIDGLGFDRKWGGRD